MLRMGTFNTSSDRTPPREEPTGAFWEEKNLEKYQRVPGTKRRAGVRELPKIRSERQARVRSWRTF